MNYKMTGRFIAQILLLEALFMIPAMFISLYCGENASVKAFLVTMVLLLVVSCLLRFLCRGAKSNFYATDGMVCVALSWIVLSPGYDTHLRAIETKANHVCKLLREKKQSKTTKGKD